MEFIANLISESIVKVWVTFVHNWPYLVVSIVLAGVLKVILNPEKITAFFQRYSKAGVIGATVVAVTTPLCSCGTMAIILGMMANTMPWAPIIAFMVASPLTSPQEMIYSAGLFGWPFAAAFYVSSILLGLAGGLAAAIIENRGWLKNQSRFAPAEAASGPAACSCSSQPIQPEKPLRNEKAASCGCGSTSPFIPLDIAPVAAVAGCGCAPIVTPAALEVEDCGCKEESYPHKAQSTSAFFTAWISNQDWNSMAREIWKVTRQLVPLFFIFVFIGYFLNGLIPPAWVSAVFGQGNIYSVPLAATIGLPLYINTEASLPLVRALIDGGMSQGAALAFLITGAGTSIGALSGALTIARWRVIGIVVGTLWLGGIVIGYGYNLLLAANLF